jgi:WD40-like Beta Propeller Repeat
VRRAAVVALATVCGFALLAIVSSSPSKAAFPGLNGRIAYGFGDASSRAIWAANPDGTAPTMLTSSGSSENPTYSADGSRIAFERNDGVAVMNADGSGVTQLVSGSHTMSQEFKWVGEYETDEEPPRTIPVRIQTIEGSHRTFSSPSFSPDGSQLAVSEGNEETKATVVCEVAAVGGECLGAGPPAPYFRVEFECLACGARIVTISPTSGAQTSVVTSPPNEVFDGAPAFSVDGKLAFSRSDESESSPAIHVVDSPGAAPNQVTVGGSPDFSPDGSRIAFLGPSGELAIVGAAGGPVTVVPTPAPPGALSASVGPPSFSPDGTKLAFFRTIFYSESWDYGVFTVGADGSGLTKVVDRGFEPGWGPATLPPPPALVKAKAKARKGKVRLSKKGKATIATIVCGNSPCTLEVLLAKLKAGKEKCFVRARLARKLAPGKSAPLKVRVVGKCLAAVKEAGKGKLVTKVRVVDALGKQTLTLRVTVLSPKSAKSRQRRNSA